jgi:hypothetical protein
MLGRILSLAAFVLFATSPAGAQQNGFDLAGPDLSISVTRGEVDLPIAAVPALRKGDRITARAMLPADQSARYRLVVAFLRGATNPPPADWFFEVPTWKRKNVLTVTVPDGAEQAIVFLAPDAGGGFSAVRGAVRGRPGVFVRAAQDLYQASLDRARLDAFVTAIGEQPPERLVTAAPVLANALRIKLNAECLSRPRNLQAACLTQNRDTLVLQAQRGATLTDTLTGTPVDIAYRVAATREGGAGYYSPYIGLARDLARLFGAFRSAQYQYLPALALGQGDRSHLLLNSAPSFQNPRSVLVAPLPPIGDAPPPAWRSGATGALCLARPGVVLPLDEAALLFATGYARDLSLRVTTADGTTSALPLVADATAGGVRLADGAQLPATGPITDAVVQGKWGFDTFSGPRMAVQLDGAGTWRAQPDDNVVVGRDHPLTLTGGAASCVSAITLRDATGLSRSLTWKETAPTALETILPLTRTKPGALTLTIARHGAVPADALTLTGRGEPSRLDRFVVAAGDRSGMLDGARLDQVARLDMGGVRFAAGALTRGKDGDRLELTADAAIDRAPGDVAGATVTLRDGRSVAVPAVVAPPRVKATLLERQVAFDPPAGAVPLTLPEGLVPASASLTFSLRVTNGTLADGDAVEVAGESGSARLTIASGAVQRVGGDVVVTTIAPQAVLGATVAGPLRVRLWHDGVAGDWQPLARVVRLPVVTRFDCTADECRLTGSGLYLVAAIGRTADMANAVAVPPGFVGPSIAVPRAPGDALYLRLHDAPDQVLRLTTT